MCSQQQQYLFRSGGLNLYHQPDNDPDASVDHPFNFKYVQSFFFLSLEGGQKEETRKQRDWGGDGAAVFYVNKLPSASRRHELEFGLANDCCLTCTWNWGRCIQLSKL